jgi:hypothetical protein
MTKKYFCSVENLFYYSLDLLYIIFRSRLKLTRKMEKLKDTQIAE